MTRSCPRYSLESHVRPLSASRRAQARAAAASATVSGRLGIDLAADDLAGSRGLHEGRRRAPHAVQHNHRPQVSTPSAGRAPADTPERISMAGTVDYSSLVRLGLLGPAQRRPGRARANGGVSAQRGQASRAPSTSAPTTRSRRRSGSGPSRSSAPTRATRACGSAPSSVAADGRRRAASTRSCAASARGCGSSPSSGCRREELRTVEMFGDRVAVLIHDKALLDEEDIFSATFLIYGKSDAPLRQEDRPALVPDARARRACPAAAPSCSTTRATKSSRRSTTPTGSAIRDRDARDRARGEDERAGVAAASLAAS